MSATFLPFLKKQPAPKPAAKPQEEEDPLAVKLPPPKVVSKLGTTNSKFISKLNNKPQGTKHGTSHAGPRNTQTAAKGTSSGKPGPGASVHGLHKGAVGNGAGPLGKAAKPAVLSPAAAKAEAEKRRLKQLERLAKLGALAPQDAPPEVLAKYEQAKKQAAEIKRQQELAAKRKAAEQQRQRQLEEQRQQMQQELARIAAEKQRLRAGRAGTQPAGAVAGAAAGIEPGRGLGAANGQGRPTAGARPLGQLTAAAGVGQQPGQGSNSQQQKDPYAHLNPKQRAFMLARNREREGRMNGRRGSERRRGSSADRYGSDLDGYGSDDYADLDDFICDDDEGDWRSQLRAMTGYDPRKYKESFFDDRKMEASAAEIAAEERRSARMGRAEDEREAEEEARRMAAKEAKEAKKSRKRGASALFDD